MSQTIPSTHRLPRNACATPARLILFSAFWIFPALSHLSTPGWTEEPQRTAAERNVPDGADKALPAAVATARNQQEQGDASQQSPAQQPQPPAPQPPDEDPPDTASDNTSTPASTASRIDVSQLVGLPLNGRSYSQLATLQAGVSDPSAASGSRGVSGGGLTVAGSRSTSNVFLLDGTNIMDITNTVPRSAAGVQLGSDSVLEVQVFSTTFQAEYGLGSGGILNSITQSGTPEFHGTFFEFLRNSKLDAKNFIDPHGEPIPPFKRNQFGFTITGPILKDRSYFMTSFEGLRDRLTETNIDFFPDRLSRQGIITNAEGETIRTVAIAENIRPYLDLYPLPNLGLEGDGIGRNAASQFLPSNEVFATVRIDHQISERDSLFARYSFDDATSENSQQTFLFNMLSNSRQQYMTLVGTHIFSPALLTSYRFGYTRPVTDRASIASIDIPKNLFFVPTAPQFGVMNIPGISGFGPNRATPDADITNTFQYGADVILQRGQHTLKAGLDLQRFRWDTFSSSRLGGLWSFNSLEDFLQGGKEGTNLEVTLPGSSNLKAFRQTMTSLYFQDFYDVRAGLQWNFGVRYEYSTLIADRDGRTAFLPDIVNDTSLQTGPLLESNPSAGSIAPRVGFSWAPRPSGNTVLRGGFGLFYDHLREYMVDQLKNGAPFFNIAVAKNFDASGTFPDAVAAATSEGEIPLQAQVLDYRKATNPVVMRYDFSIHHQFPSGWDGGAAYVGARGNHLFRSYEANLFPAPVVRADGSLFFPDDCNAPGNTTPSALCVPNAGPINPAFPGGINLLASDAQSFYNAVIFSASKSISRGFSLRGSYTFSKSVDDASAHSGSQASPVQFGALRTLERGLSNFDVRHRLSLNYFYAIPMGTSQNRLLARFFSGWRLGGILRMRSGTPYSPRVNVRTPGYEFSAVRPNLLPGFQSSLTKGETAGCSNPDTGQVEVIAGQKLGSPDLAFDPCAFAAPPPGTLGNAGKNILISAPVFNTDISLQRDFVLDGRLRLQFRSDVFNILNHPNFNKPQPRSAIVFSGSSARRNSTAGTVESTVTTARQIQFSLRLSF